MALALCTSSAVLARASARTVQPARRSRAGAVRVRASTENGADAPNAAESTPGASTYFFAGKDYTEEEVSGL